MLGTTFLRRKVIEEPDGTWIRQGLFIEGRGGVGTGPASPPPSFQKCTFSGSKVPFTSVKNVVQIAFFAQWPLIYDWICFCILVCPEKFCYFRVKLWHVRENFDIFGKIFGMSGKFLICPENFLRCPPWVVKGRWGGGVYGSISEFTLYMQELELDNWPL